MLILFAATRAFNHRYYWKRWLIGFFILAVLLSSTVNPIDEINSSEMKSSTFKSRLNVAHDDARVDHTPSSHDKHAFTTKYRFRTIPIKIDSEAASHVWNIPGDVTPTGRAENQALALVSKDHLQLLSDVEISHFYSRTRPCGTVGTTYVI
jgi:hypothetical protein